VSAPSERRAAESLVTYVRDGPVAIVTLNRPDRLNALNAELLEALRTVWESARDDQEVRAVVLTGAGERAFCAGADLRDMAPVLPSLADLLNPDHALRPDEGLQLYKPVIAAVNGHCLGGGLTLLLATDIRVTVPEATFGLPEAGWGILASCGGTQRLVRQIPRAIAMEMLLSGRRLDGEEAARWGLVNQVVRRAGLLDAAMDIARRVAGLAPLAVQATKELAVNSHDMPTATGLRLEATLVRLLQGSDDAREGALAWAQRRPPRYQGR
jgi:E-phenylitaconyl-CoA hydratase